MSTAMMSVLDQIRLRSTYQLMTHLPTPCWTPVGARLSQRSSPHTPLQMLLSITESRQPALHGPPPPPPPPTIPWDYTSSSNTLHPFPSHWRQHHRMRQCWQSRDSPSLSCHVTLINTARRGTTATTPSNSPPTRSPKTFNLFSSPELSAVPWLFKLTLC